MTFLCLFLGFCVIFLLGFALGLLSTPSKSVKRMAQNKAAIADDTIKQLQEEYNNFLSYDGSEQV